MMSFILFFLIILWLFGYLQVPLFSIAVFYLGDRVITLNDILVFFIIIWLIGILPTPFRQIALVLFLLWILAATGFIALAGFGNIVLLAIIFGLIAFIARAAHISNGRIS